MELLDRERSALRRMDWRALQELNEAKAHVLETLVAHDRKRMGYLKSLTGIEKPHDAIARFRDLSHPHAVSAQAVLSELIELGGRVKRAIEDNRTLTAHGVALVHGALQVLRESLGGQVYDAVGQWTGTTAAIAVNVRG